MCGVLQSKLNADELAVVHDEVEIMHRIQHTHCVELFEMFETQKKIYMVMELLTGGELFDRIVAKGSYSEKEASEVIAAVTSAIQYLHNIGVVHRDLKPENLIYLSPDIDSPIKITYSTQHTHTGATPPSQSLPACRMDAVRRLMTRAAAVRGMCRLLQ